MPSTYAATPFCNTKERLFLEIAYKINETVINGKIRST